MADEFRHRVRVSGLPSWLDALRLLGPGPWAWTDRPRTAEADLPRPQAADVQARLRRLGLGGARVEVEVTPPLPRAAVRRARRDDALRRRDTTPGWSRPAARAQGEGRYSLTPEALASRIAARAQGRDVVDACAGAGGNTVAFARAGCRVIALEPDPERRHELRHNLRVYGVADRVDVRGQRLEEAACDLAGDLLFADPPWGRDYDPLRCRFGDLPLLPTVLAVGQAFRETWLKLPPSFELASLPRPGRTEAVFGEAPGDHRRVKFLWVRLGGLEEDR